MTRLTPSDIGFLALESSLMELENYLLSLTGVNFIALAAKALDKPLGPSKEILARQLVAVVPDTSGEGLIEGFSQALASICALLGTHSFIAAPDALGFKEAKERGASLTLSSDDKDFLCRSCLHSKSSHNGPATGRGFAQILSLMTGEGPKFRSVLVLGAGPVGLSGAQRLIELGFKPIIYDPNLEKALKAVQLAPGALLWDRGLGEIAKDFDLILDASCATIPWPEEKFKPGSLISAPGLPGAVPPSSRYTLFREPLVVGTAVMLLKAAWPSYRNL
ncbi:MAG: 3-methylornithyl-N6-L-lysine dehydrogenase PylD [Deltaproteobacteria bacterium]|jgi:pyrrolysine biosynthesis protein PylD|nr:3-methylornithyl-N6-L-lysine dehydrogenase PylD [Deltaproteobacteria bacterium]